MHNRILVYNIFALLISMYLLLNEGFNLRLDSYVRCLQYRNNSQDIL